MNSPVSENTYEAYEWHLSQIRWHEIQLKKYQTLKNMIKWSMKRHRKEFIQISENHKIIIEKMKGLK